MSTTKISPDSSLPLPTSHGSKIQEIPRIDSGKLFGQGNSVQIEHEGKVYDLRVTRLGKLILTA